MSRLTRKILLKHLEKSDKEALIEEILTLHNKFKNVREFYKAELSEDSNSLLDSYKKKVAEAYSAANPKERRTNLNVNRLISEFRKVSISEQDVIDLLLFRVECGIAAIKRNNRRSQTFHNCLVNSFAEALLLMNSPIVFKENEKRIKKIATDSKAGNYGMAQRIESLLKASIS